MLAGCAGSDVERGEDGAGEGVGGGGFQTNPGKPRATSGSFRRVIAPRPRRLYSVFVPGPFRRDHHHLSVCSRDRKKGHGSG